MSALGRWRRRLVAPAGFVGSHLVRELALVYQRYLFFGTLGADAFGLASMAVAPALFIVGLLTMITGELVIALKSGRAEGRTCDALKYILALETAGALTGMVLLMIGAWVLPDVLVPSPSLLILSALVIAASAFNQIALNWALLEGRRSLYGGAFYLEAAVILLASRWLLDTFGAAAVILAYGVRPLTITGCVVVGLGARRVWGGLVRVVVVGRARAGAAIHSQAGHHVGSLLIKSAWSSLDVLMVGSLAGERGAGHYRILKTLASVPSVAISPVWSWLRPTIVDSVRRGEHKALARRVAAISALLSTPALVMLLVPSATFDAVYHWVFPKDNLPPHVLKYSMVCWWLVASGSGWARSLAVAAGRLEASTTGNVIAFLATFVGGPLLVVGAGASPLLIVPVTLAALNVYWAWFLVSLSRTTTAT